MTVIRSTNTSTWLVLVLLATTVFLQCFEVATGMVTRTDNNAYIDLSQDIQSISRLVQRGEVQAAAELYRDGKHAEKSPGVMLTLAGLVLEMGEQSDLVNNVDNLSDNPTTPAFLFHLYGQVDRTLNLAFDTHKLNYINDEMEQLFGSLASSSNLATASYYNNNTASAALVAEAIWILNMWMYGTHVLYRGVYECYERSKADAPEVLDIGIAGFDMFINLWLGSGQTPASSETGFSLYKWTQQLGQEFGSTSNGDGTGEAITNTRIMSIHQEAVRILSTKRACTRSNPGTASRLWELVINLQSEMTKPLVQGFLSAMLDKDATRVDIYSKALIPSLSRCRPSLYKKLHKDLIVGTFSDDPTFVSDILNLVPDIAYCLGYSCKELGNTRIGACNTHDVFRPTTKVGNVAAADLDVYQMKILASLKANDFAYLIYMNGANIQKSRENPNDALSYVSLHDIAVSEERSSAQPFLDIYVSYNQEKDYGDKVIQDALTGKSKWVSAEQIAAIVATTAAHQILFLEAVTKLKIAVQQCREADPNVGFISALLNPIDEAAALLIGSMEGTKLGGSADLEDGQLMYNIANRHAFQFNTINKLQYAKSVSTMEDLLFEARGELDVLDCENLELSAEGILKYAMVGITQALVRLAVTNEQLGEFSTSADLAQAEGLALSILPLIGNFSKDIASSIAKNMIWYDGEFPVPNGGVAVGKLLGQGFTYGMQLECKINLGSIQEVDPCDGVLCPTCVDVYDKKEAKKEAKNDDGNDAKAFARWVSAVASIMLLGLVFVLYRKKRRRRTYERQHVRSLESRNNGDTTSAFNYYDDRRGNETRGADIF